MSSLSNKPSKSNPPFYFYEGRGWKIDTKVKVEGTFRHLSYGWYRTLNEARSDYQTQTDALIARYTKAEKRRTEISYEEFKEVFLEYRRTQVRGSTLAIDKTRFHTVFDPVFKNMDVKNVFKRENALKIQQKIGLWSANRKNKNKALSYYLAMLEFAFNREYLEDDADYRRCKSEITMIKSTEQDEQTQEKTILTSEQLERLIEVIDDAHDKMLTMLMSETGLRIGEALALRVSDFDFIEGQLNVSRTEAIDEFGQRKLYNRTKTSLGLRSVPLSRNFLTIVMSYCDAFGYRGNDLIFPSYEDKQASMESSAYRQRLTKYCELAGVPRITPHSLRHSFCTRLSQKCVTDADRIARSYIMGHSVEVDEAVYASHNQLQTAKKLIGGN